MAITERQTEFGYLLDEWHKDTAIHSFWRKAAQHPLYPELLKFSDVAVPMVLLRLKTDHSIFLSMLLCELTGETPSYEPIQDSGFLKFDVDRFAKAWLKWGSERGY